MSALRPGRMLTIKELLESQRRSTTVRCVHCGRDSADRDSELVEAALRARIRVLEQRLDELTAKLDRT